MSRYTPKRSRGGGSRVKVDPATALHDLAVELFDPGDGHGADWAAAAEASFRCAFACLRQLPPDDPRAATIARRAHDAAYGLLTGSPDSGAAYTAAGSRPSSPASIMNDPAPNSRPSR